MNFPRTLALFALIYTAACSSAQAETSEAAAATYNQGNQFYARARYQEALATYERALATGVHNPDLYYNLGNANLKAGRLGTAILSYNRGLRLRPRDPDLRHNLDYARVLIRGKLPEAEQGALSRLADSVLGKVSLDELTIILSAFYLCLFVGALIWILRPPPWLRNLPSYLVAIGAAGFIICSPLFMTKLYREALSETGIVMQEKVSAYSGPGEGNARLFELYEGMEMALRQGEAGWRRVVLKNGLSGWIPEGSFEAVSSLPALNARP